MIRLQLRDGNLLRLPESAAFFVAGRMIPVRDVAMIEFDQGELGLLEGERDGEQVRAIQVQDAETGMALGLVMDPDTGAQLGAELQKRNIQIARTLPPELRGLRP